VSTRTAANRASADGAALWLPAARRSGRGVPLLCFPPAGAGAGFFRDWGRHLPKHALVPVQLPGREERFAEAPLADAEQAAAGAAAAIAGEAWPQVVLLGYSYGALLAFEAARALEARRAAGAPAPRVAAVVACARAAPQTQGFASIADADDAALIAYVRGLGGLPPEIAAAPELLQLFLPTLRADFRANDGYAAPPVRRIDAPIVTAVGDADPATGDGRADGWAARTRGGHARVQLPGGHFFAVERPDASLAAIAGAIFEAAMDGLTP
jgi:pyochelin biosynthetic protein PchC